MYLRYIHVISDVVYYVASLEGHRELYVSICYWIIVRDH